MTRGDLDALDLSISKVRVAVWRLELPVPLDWQYAIWEVEDPEDPGSQDLNEAP